VEVDRGVARIGILRTVADLGIARLGRPHTLEAGVGLDQGAVDRELLAAGQAFQKGVQVHAIEERPHEAVLLEALAVHAEDLRRPDALGRPQVQEPAEQQVVADLLAELDLAADAVEGLQQQGLQQPLGRHARPAGAAVGRVEVARHARQHRIGPPLDLTQRMAGRNQVLNVEGVEHVALGIHSTAHGVSSVMELPKCTRSPSVRPSFLATC